MFRHSLKMMLLFFAMGSLAVPAMGSGEAIPAPDDVAAAIWNRVEPLLGGQ